MILIGGIFLVFALSIIMAVEFRGKSAPRSPSNSLDGTYGGGLRLGDAANTSGVPTDDKLLVVDVDPVSKPFLPRPLCLSIMLPVEPYTATS